MSECYPTIYYPPGCDDSLRFEVGGPPGPPGPQGPPGSPGNGVIVTNEAPAGIINGSNATFTTAFNFVPETVEVFVNGLKQRRITDFNTSGQNTILLTDSPFTGDSVQVDYLRS